MMMTLSLPPFVYMTLIVLLTLIGLVFFWLYTKEKKKSEAIAEETRAKNSRDPHPQPITSTDTLEQDAEETEDYLKAGGVTSPLQSLSTQTKQTPNLLNDIIEGSPIGIVSVYSDGKIYAHNHMFLDMVNQAFLDSDRPPCQYNLKQQSLLSFFHTELSQEAVQKLEQFFRGGEVTGPIEVFLVQSSNLTFHVYLSSNFHKEDLKTLYFVDISDQKKLSVQLSQV